MVTRPTNHLKHIYLQLFTEIAIDIFNRSLISFSLLCWFRFLKLPERIHPKKLIIEII